MKCVIMQPTFFPWAGYFNLISQADSFVFLDDVQFEKQSWQSRNKILVQGKAHWISMPVINHSLKQLIKQVEVCEKSGWREKILRTISQNYASHLYRDAMLNVVNNFLEIESTNLAVINITLIHAFCEQLELKPKMFRSSELGIKGNRTERLIRICEHLDCDEYISPIGAANYLEQDGFFERSDIRLTYQNYNPLPYFQKKSSVFISHLSTIDVVANLGWDCTKEYVRHAAVNLN